MKKTFNTFILIISILLIVISVIILLFVKQFNYLIIISLIFISIFLIIFYLQNIKLIKKINMLNKENNELKEINNEQKKFINEKSNIPQTNNSENQEIINEYKKIFNSIYSESSFYNETISNFFNSIIKNVTDTTTPLSTNLSEVKEKMAGFVNHIKQYDDEIINRSGINKIIEKNKILQEMITKASSSVKDTFLIFNNNLKNLDKIINKVFENSLQIQEIADKINVLSINAAIESARSGIYGKGFKVISDEIKKLSGNTFSFLKEINSTVMESRNVLENINIDFAGREKELIKIINDQDIFAGGCYNIFENYYNNFYDIYNQFQLFTEIISEKIEKISPVLQIHEITIQEIENLTKIVNDFINDNLNQISKIDKLNNEFDEKEIIVFVEKIRTRLTTSREFESLKKAISEKGLKFDIDLKIDTKEIELF